MGINYSQSCILGWEFTREQVEKEISPAEYSEQPRFDTKTGTETHKEKVLVKERDYIFECAGIQNEELWYLAEQVAERHGLRSVCDDESFYIGISLGDREDFGRADLLEGDVQLDRLAVHLNRLKDMQEDIGTPDSPAIHFIASVG